jgi:uncharacterized membrane protein
MLPNPLHPAVVHFPIVLAILAPLVAAGALLAIRRGTNVRRTWSLVAALLAALAASAWVSLETGEEQEERVESAVVRAPLHAHAESAEAFVVMSAGVLAIALVGFAGGRVGRVARIAGAAGTLALAAAVVRVGHTGGQLAYRYGAASVYAQNALTPRAGTPETGPERSSRENRRDHDDRE